MRKTFFMMLMMSGAVLGLVLSGCGGGGGVSSPSSNTSQMVTGVAASGAPIVGTITLKDASATQLVRTTPSAADGSFAINVNGLTPPFMLSVTWSDSSGTNKLYSFSNGPGTANINPFSNAVFAAAGGVDDPLAFSGTPSLAMLREEGSRNKATSDALQAKLSPLFQLYAAAQNPIDDDYKADHTGLDAMFDDVRITVSKGTITVTNRQTGAIIFTAPMNDIPSGTFYVNNMPGATTDGVTLYTNKCSICHQPLATSTVAGVTATQIQAAIKSVGTMSSLSNLSALQIWEIASALSSTQSPTAPPLACTYTYDAWGACQPNNTQTRSVLTSSPDGCTGTPVTSRACVYTPPVTSCIYTYDAWGACQSNNTQTRNVLTSSPSGCTGTPITSQPCAFTSPACTYAYNAWSACQPDNTQTRTVASSTPVGCTGTPVLSQSCTYTAPACIYTYNAWSACQPNNTQTRTVASTTPNGCTGTPVVSQPCVYTQPSTVTIANVTASCTGCHGLTVNTTVFKSGGYTVTGRTASTWLSTVNSMVGMGAKLASGTTAQDYANFLATLP